MSAAVSRHAAPREPRRPWFRRTPVPVPQPAKTAVFTDLGDGFGAAFSDASDRIAARFAAARATRETPAVRPLAPSPFEAAPWGAWDQPDGFPAALRADALSGEHRRWYGWDITALDVPPAHARPYTGDALPAGPPPASAPDIFDDLRILPCLRDAVRTSMQRGCRECRTCGRTVPGRDWQERFAAQLAHIASGADAPETGRAA